MVSLVKLYHWNKKARLLSNFEALKEFENEKKYLLLDDFRDRQQSLKRLAFAGFSVAANSEAKDIIITEKAILSLQIALRNGVSIQQMPAALGALYAHKMQLLGGQEPVVKTSAKRSVITDSATLCISSNSEFASGSLAIDFSKLSKEEFENAVRLAVCADGRYQVELRYIDGNKPALLTKEYKKILDMSSSGRVRLNNGIVYFGSTEMLKAGASLQISDGVYALQFFAVGTINRWKIIAVLANSNEEISNWVDEPRFDL